MSLQIGIVGLPNVGKSTLFNALTKAGAAVASYPFTTIDPNVGVVAVPDPRLDRVAAIVRPKEVKPTTVEFVDIAGLVKDAHKGEGLGNQFLGHIRNVDAIALVVRCFEDPDVAHVTAELDPVADSDVIDLELILADLATVERREEKVHSSAKAQPKAYAAELDLLTRLKSHLQAGRSARQFAASEHEAELLLPLTLLTAKPRLYVANVGEGSLPGGGPLAAAVLERAQQEGAQAVVICAQMEADLADWPPDEAAEYRAALGLEAPGLERLVHAGYRLLDSDHVLHRHGHQRRPRLDAEARPDCPGGSRQDPHRHAAWLYPRRSGLVSRSDRRRRFQRRTRARCASTGRAGISGAGRRRGPHPLLPAPLEAILAPLPVCQNLTIML